MRIIGLVVYLVLYIYDIKEKRQAISLVIIISCLRGISYFRLFEETRYMSQLLFSVVKDIKSFAILLLYSSFSISLVFMIQIGDDKDLYQFLKLAYLLNLGQFDDNIMDYDMLT